MYFKERINYFENELQYSYKFNRLDDPPIFLVEEFKLKDNDINYIVKAIIDFYKEINDHTTEVEYNILFNLALNKNTSMFFKFKVISNFEAKRFLMKDYIWVLKQAIKYKNLFVFE